MSIKFTSDELMKKYDRIPVITVLDSSSSKKIVIEKTKYLVPKDVSFGQLMYHIRKNIRNLTQQQALFFFCKKHLMQPSTGMMDVYENHKSKDGFLYVTVAIENTFG